MLLKLFVNPSDPPPEPLIVAETVKSKKKDITIIWCNVWTGSGNIRLCNENDIVLTENIFEISRYLGRVVETSLYGDTCIKSRTEIDHWLTFALGQLDVKERSHVNYVKSLIYLDHSLLTRTWLCCKKFTLADIHVYCTLLKNKYLEKELTENYCNITRWYKHVESLAIVKDAFIQMKKNTLPKEQVQFCVEQTNEQMKTRKQEGKFIDLPGAEMGKVVVRFPPEASGYLHIGHAKAALLNQYYAEAFQGQLIMRFDDTNPAKESTEFEEAILEDLRLLQIKPDRFTHTSDYFDVIQEYCTKLIKEGKAYVDDTPAHIMKEQREKKLKSENRDNTVEKNLLLWEEMQRGTEKGQECCVRAKINYESVNGCMRDPTIYRCKLELHPYTQDKYKVYPTYDFACPIVDSIENVTHTLRTTEYHDRDAQFYWILDALELRHPYIWEYSRLNMTHTVLSKRKLTWFVNEGLVDGWDDPRFPTVRGILRRGMTVEGLKQFIIAQGSSRSVVFMEWDKIWAINKKVIDPIAFRYTALDYDKLVPVNVLDAKEGWLTVQNHPKNPSKGIRNVLINSTIFIENDDAMNLIEGQNATFINWGNLKIMEINRKQDGSVMAVHARLNLEDTNYKNTLKITWVTKPSSVLNEETDNTNSIPCYAVYFDHIMNIPVLGKDDDFKNFVAKNTRKEVQMLGEVALKNVKKGEIIQLQRKGFFICDVPYAPLSFFSSRERPLILFHIPDGHMPTSASAISQKGDLQKSKKLKVEKSKNGNANNAEESILYDKIQKQNEKLRQLQNTLNEEQHILDSLQAEYKTVTGHDCKLREITTPTTANSITVESEETPKAQEISEAIQKQGDKVRNLKSSKADKSIIDQEIKILLILKDDYKNATGQVWKPGQIAVSTTIAVTKTESKEVSKPEQISDEIQKQGDKVRNLKSSKVEKSIIDQEVKILLSLKHDYKNVTGQDWKPEQTAVPSTASSTVTQSKEILVVQDIFEAIQKQGDKVRNLKSSKADKSIIDQEVKILLSLKDDYKNTTGQEWKPGQIAASTTIAVTKIDSKEVSKAEQISDEIQKQGDKVRNLKSSKADKSIIDQEVKILLSLKDDYKNTTGQDWKPGKIAASTTIAVTKTESKDVLKSEQISDEIQKQGDKVRNLKSSKTDKSIIDQEVKILLSLKDDYKNTTGQDWKPDKIAASTTIAVTKTESKEVSKSEQISDEIQKQGDKVRNLKSSKADKSIIDQEVKILLSLKDDYKNTTSQDWKPGKIAASTTIAVTKTESKEVSKSEQISDEIQKQGDKVRNLKSSKADKSIIDQEIKILLSLKDDYKNATGQEWKPTKAETETEPKRKKEESPKAKKPVEKEITKSSTGKDADTCKTRTRLGLEAKKDENFFDWYSQIITKSGMIEYYDVSGCYILRPWSFAIWKIIKEYIDKVITSLGVHECYFPIFVTRNVLEMEKTHIADFAPEVAWVTKCGESELSEPIAIRPTSETVMYPAYAKWLKSDTELPLRLNQWNNVVRWEFKDPKPFLRTREFLWQEGHTAFATKAEADEEVLTILDMYGRVYEDLLAVPVIKGRKTEKEKFAGGDYTTTVEAYISTSGRAIQGATSHHLGQNFSKMFNIQVEGIAEGDEKTFVYQNSWGLTTRTIGVMIMVHGDDRGLVLPPKVASIQVVVVPCGVTASTTATQKEILQSECKKLVDKLISVGHFKVCGDFRNNRTPGWKFNHWELKGVPVRIELGPKDLEKNQVTLVRRDTSVRSIARSDEIIAAVTSLLDDLQTKLLERARDNLNEHIKQVEDWSNFSPELNKKNLLLSPFCGEPSCEERIKADSARVDSDEPGASMGAKSLCIPFEQPELTKPLNEMKCIHHSCTSKPKFYTLFGRSY